VQHFIDMGKETVENNGFNDYYESLQVSPNADSETIERVFRHLAKRYHPDNAQTGSLDRFNLLIEAHKVLSNPEQRAAYDVKYDEIRAFKSKLFLEASVKGGLEGDGRVRYGILSTLYLARRRNAQNGGVGGIQLEQVLDCAQDQMEFNIWYLKEKGWIQRTDTGTLAITAAGVDEIEEKQLFLRKDRLLPAGREHFGEHQELDGA
jgi:curved DNA-binding protein